LGERLTRELQTPGPLDAGDHVAWVSHRPGEFEWLAAAQLSHGTRVGDKLFLLAPPRPARAPVLVADTVTVLDPVRAFLQGGAFQTETVLTMLREQDGIAREEGFRGIRVVADMDWLLDMPADFADVLDFEQRLDGMVADLKALVVCVYRQESFVDSELAQLMSVHPHIRQSPPGPDAFRIWSAGGGRWRVSGDVDITCAAAFSARLASAAAGSARFVLDLRSVTFIDVAGLRAIVRCSLDCRVEIAVEGLSAATRKCWNLVGFSASAPNVEVVA
jgi:anti-anti-sigma factor